MPYAYSYNNPIMLRDLDGHKPEEYWETWNYWDDEKSSTMSDNDWPTLSFGWDNYFQSYDSGIASDVFYDNGGSLQRNYEIGLLGRVTYAEAAGQYNIPYAMEGVASSVKNRVDSNKSYFGGNTYEEVIYSGQYAAVGCKTCYRWNEFVNPDSLKGSASAGYNRALEVAEGVYSGTILDPTNGATFFHSYSLTELQKESPWFYNKIQNGSLIKTMGGDPYPFSFYRER